LTLWFLFNTKVIKWYWHCTNFDLIVIKFNNYFYLKCSNMFYSNKSYMFKLANDKFLSDSLLCKNVETVTIHQIVRIFHWESFAYGMMLMMMMIWFNNKSYFSYMTFKIFALEWHWKEILPQMSSNDKLFCKSRNSP